MNLRFVPVFLLWAAAVGVPAQSIRSDASIDGSIVIGQNAARNTARNPDRSGATITLTLPGGQVRSTASDAQGAFRFAALPGGTYTLTVRKPGYAEKTTVAVLSAGQGLSLSIALQPAIPPASEASSAVLHPDASRPVVLQAPTAAAVPAPQRALLNHSLSASENLEDGLPASGATLADIQEFRMAQDLMAQDLMAQDVVAQGSVAEDSALLSEMSRGGALHGEIYGMAGSAALPDPNRLRDSLALPITQAGASLGADTGRASWFAAYGRHVLNRTQLLSEMLAQPALPGGNNPDALTSSKMLARFDRRIGDRDSLDAGYEHFALTGNRTGNSAGNAGQSPALGLDTRQQMLSVTNMLTVSPGAVNETRVLAVSGHVQLPSGMPADGVQADAATLRRYRVYEAADNLYRRAGPQSLRLGGDFLANQMTVAFLEGSMGSPSISQSSRDAGFYVLNQWKVTPGFQISAGTRYDLQFVKAVPTDANNLAPQIGFTWSPAPNSGTVLRGGFGLIESQLPLPLFSGAADPSTGAVNLARSARFSSNPNSPAFTPATWSSLGTYTVLGPFPRSAYAEQASFGFEQSLGTRSVLSADVQHVTGIHLQPSDLRSVTVCAAAGSCAPSSEFAATQEIGSGESSSYTSLIVSFLQNPTHWGAYRVSYTRAQVSAPGAALDDFMGEDEMQRVSFLGSLHTSTENGGRWWNQLTHNLTLSGYGDLTARNALPGLDFIHMNARLTKAIPLGLRARLECFAETANMTDYRTYSMTHAASELNQYGLGVLSSYGRYADLATPSATQAGLRLSF